MCRAWNVTDILAQKVRYCDITYSLSVMAAIFDLPVTATSKSVHTRFAALLNPENVGVAFRISSLSSIEAKILSYFYLCLPG